MTSRVSVDYVIYTSSLQSAMFPTLCSPQPILNSKIIHVLVTGTKLILTSLIIYVDYSLPIMVYKHFLIKKLNSLRDNSYPSLTNR